MKLKTVRVRRSRPSAPALALALMLTMLCVYLISLSAIPAPAASDASAAALTSEAELRMEGLRAAFVCEARYDDLTEARVAAANCAASGGAGLLLSDNGQFAVIREAVSTEAAPEDAIERSADGLTLRLSGAAADIQAISDAVNFVRAQAAETGNLAAALESGAADAGSLAALLEVYRTQGQRARDALAQVADHSEITDQLRSVVQSELDRLDAALPTPTPGQLKLLHAAACTDYLGLASEARQTAR